MAFGYVSRPSNQEIIVSCEVVVVSVLNKLITCQFAVFSKEHPTGILINKRTGDGFNHTAILSKAVTTKILALSCNSVCTASQSITLVVEEVTFAFHFVPFILIVSQRVIVTSVLNTINHYGFPCAKHLTLLAFHLINAVFGKREGTNRCITRAVIEIVSAITNHNKALLLEVTLIIGPADAVMIETGKGVVGLMYAILIKCAHYTVDQMRASKLNAIYIISGMVCVPTICHKNAVNISLAVSINAIEQFAPNYASQLAINDFKLVISYRNNRTPVNNRITLLTECSTGVTTFGTSCCLISKNNNCMHMPSGILKSSIEFLIRHASTSIRPKFRINFNRFRSEGNNLIISCSERTANNLNSQNGSACKRLFPTVFRQEIILSTLSWAFCCTPFPSTNGKRNKSTFPHNITFANASDNNRSNFIHRISSIDYISCFKSLCHFHIIQFPYTVVVQIKCHNNFICLFHIRSFYINIIQGTKGQFIKRRVMRNHIYRGNIVVFRLNLNLASNLRNISAHVCNFKRYCMYAVCKFDIRR